MKRILICVSLIMPLLGGKISPAERQIFQPEKQSEKLSITGVMSGGKYIILSDKSRYEIYPKDRNISGGWLGPADVSVTPRESTSYPYLITNEWTTSSVRARKIVEDLRESEEIESVEPLKKEPGS